MNKNAIIIIFVAVIGVIIISSCETKEVQNEKEIKFEPGWNWTIISESEGIPRMAMDSQGLPQMVYIEADHRYPPDSGYTVMWHVGSKGDEWRFSKLDKGWYLTQPSVLMDEQDKMHIIYIKRINNTLNDDAEILYGNYTKEKWHDEKVDMNDGMYMETNTAIAQGPDGVIHLAYLSGYRFENSRLVIDVKHATYNSGEWVEEIVAEDVAGKKIGMAIDQNGYLYFVYVRNTEDYCNDIVYLSSNRTGLMVEEKEFKGATDPDVKLDQNNIIHVSYMGNVNNKGCHYYVIYYTNKTEEWEGINLNNEDNPLCLEKVNIEVNEKDGVFIVFSAARTEDNTPFGLFYSNITSKGWNIKKISSNQVFDDYSSAIDAEGNIHVTFVTYVGEDKSYYIYANNRPK